jgi:glycosyltransferase involved in cell wall biosynthesis
MAENMRVSIIIPFYNGEQTLAWTIRSARQQTYKDFEIILVDDGSDEAASHIAQEVAAERYVQDESENILRGWHGKDSDSRVKVIKKKNGGLVSALNLAITAKTSSESPICTGEVILMLNSDDWIESTFLEKTVPLMSHKVGIVSTDMHVFSESSDSVVPAKMASYEGLKLSNSIPVSSLFPRYALDQVGGFKEDTYEDWMLWLDILKSGWSHEVINEPLFHYRRAKESLTMVYKKRHVDLIRNMRTQHSEVVG